jgi:hypothetical protein
VRRSFVDPPPDPTAGAARRCVEGVDLDEPLLDGIEQWDISVDAAVIYAAVSSMADGNWRQFYRRSEVGRGSAAGLRGRTGCRPTRPNSGARPRRGRTSIGSRAGPCTSRHARRHLPNPLVRSEVKALKAAGKDVTFVKYRGEGHTFERQWQRSIERTVAYFDKHLD